MHACKCVCVCVCVCVCRFMHTGVHRGQRRAGRVTANCSHLVGVLGTKLRSSAAVGVHTQPLSHPCSLENIWKQTEEMECRHCVHIQWQWLTVLNASFISCEVHISKGFLLRRGKEQSVVVYTCDPALRSLRQEDCHCEASLGYMVRPCYKGRKKKDILNQNL